LILRLEDGRQAGDGQQDGADDRGGEAKAGQVVVVGCNDTPAEISCRLVLGWTSFDGQEKKTNEQDVVLPPFSRGELTRFEVCGDLRTGIHFAWPQLVTGSMNANDDSPALLPGLLNWGEFRQLDLGQAQVSITAEEDGGADRLVTVHAETFAHGVYLDTGADVELSDNYFDLLPGESRTVRITGAAGHHFDLKTVTVDG
jgi:beta-mannosidase